MFVELAALTLSSTAVRDAVLQYGSERYSHGQVVVDMYRGAPESCRGELAVVAATTEFIGRGNPTGSGHILSHPDHAGRNADSESSSISPSRCTSTLAVSAFRRAPSKKPSASPTSTGNVTGPAEPCYVTRPPGRQPAHRRNRFTDPRVAQDVLPTDDVPTKCGLRRRIFTTSAVPGAPMPGGCKYQPTPAAGRGAGDLNRAAFIGQLE